MTLYFSFLGLFLLWSFWFRYSGRAYLSDFCDPEAMGLNKWELFVVDILKGYSLSEFELKGRVSRHLPTGIVLRKENTWEGPEWDVIGPEGNRLPIRTSVIEAFRREVEGMKKAEKQARREEVLLREALAVEQELADFTARRKAPPPPNPFIPLPSPATSVISDYVNHVSKIKREKLSDGTIRETPL